MKKQILTLSAVIALAAAGNAQAVSDSAVTGANYVNDVFYSLPNSTGTVSTVTKDNWDLGFEITGNSSSIIANTANNNNNVRVYQSPYKVSDWANLDTTGLASWQRLDNSPTSWSEGALNSNVGGGGNFDLGWGVYDFNGDNGPQHAVNGDSIFVVKLSANSWKKLRIDRLYGSEYSFTWSDLDGNNEVKDTIKKADYTGKNFAYYSLTNAAEVNREPATADWDLLFTKYITFDYGLALGTPQAVTGVLLNKNVKAVKVSGVAVDEVDFNNYLDSFTTNINTIGYNWKSVNYSPPPTYLIEDSATYFVRRPVNGEIWKVVFTGFTGGSSGKYYFNKELVLPAPPATAAAVSALTVCSGDTAFLEANAGAGYTYQWYKGTTAIAGATSQTYGATTVGNYSVKVTDRGAFSTSTPLTVTLLPVPTVSEDATAPLCAGDANGSIEVNATGGTGVSIFTWEDNSTGATKSDLAAGNYTVYATDENNCNSSVLTITLTAPATLEVETSTTENNATATVSGGTAPYTYEWSDAEGQTTATATALADGDYTVTVTDANACSTVANITVASSAISNVDANILQFAVQPNPSNGQFSIVLTAAKNTDVRISIADITGRIVFETTENNTKTFTENVDLSLLNKGLYLISTKTVNGTSTQRLIIQ